MYEDIIDAMLPKITAAEMSAPEFQSILTGWKTIFRGIYGDGIYIRCGLLKSLTDKHYPFVRAFLPLMVAL
ncbi:Uncharacterised protein [Serratia ficaria]|uniref:hypothetical protein n=1 Tax=Serratia ficaria TaxID=61651 RepID=UPI002183F350|nr:hypothetical protein [Serratia ficaria]CAI2532421.1 Uncharacterised protein [Serratia ficaria]